MGNKIFLIDDDADWLFVMSRTLEGQGFEVIKCENAVDMFRKISASHPDVILLDIQLDGINGEDICHELKEDSNTHDIPLLMFSSNSNIAEVAKQCGADGYIPKFVPPDEIRKRILPFLAA